MSVSESQGSSSISQLTSSALSAGLLVEASDLSQNQLQAIVNETIAIIRISEIEANILEQVALIFEQEDESAIVELTEPLTQSRRSKHPAKQKESRVSLGTKPSIASSSSFTDSSPTNLLDVESGRRSVAASSRRSDSLIVAASNLNVGKMRMSERQRLAIATKALTEQLEMARKEEIARTKEIKTLRTTRSERELRLSELAQRQLRLEIHFGRCQSLKSLENWLNLEQKMENRQEQVLKAKIEVLRGKINYLERKKREQIELQDDQEVHNMQLLRLEHQKMVENYEKKCQIFREIAKRLNGTRNRANNVAGRMETLRKDINQLENCRQNLLKKIGISRLKLD